MEALARDRSAELDLRAGRIAGFVGVAEEPIEGHRTAEGSCRTPGYQQHRHLSSQSIGLDIPFRGTAEASDNSPCSAACSSEGSGGRNLGSASEAGIAAGCTVAGEGSAAGQEHLGVA